MMENSGESVDDQGSGWFEVKKKHRSSSKFSVQSWGGGFSAKNGYNLMRGQQLLNKNGGSVQGKDRSLSQSSAGNSGVNSQGGLAKSTAESNEDEKNACYLDKCVLKQDCEGSPSPSSFVENANGSCTNNPKVLSKDKPHTVHKIKWGDLEDNVLVVHHVNNVGAEIKFGDIGDDNVPGCSKNENTSNSISCTNLQENTVEASMDEDSHSWLVSPLTPKGEIMEEKCKGISEISSGVLEQEIDNEKIISADDGFKEIHTGHIKTIVNNQVDCSFLSPQASGAAVKPDVSLEVDKPKTSEEPIVDSDSSIEIVSLDAVSLPPENSGPETLRESITDCIEDGRKSDLSNAQLITAIGEGDAGESKERFRERLWCFLFENLNRAVDELYLLCELECDVEQMKEAILVLEEAASDFKELSARVQEFEDVKKSSFQSVDDLPITLKSDHRRPHALSWEVRRMTTSPHRAEILSSSLEAFKKIQQERATQLSRNSMKSLGQDNSNCASISGDNLKKSVTLSDVTSNDKELGIKSRKLSGGSDLTQRNLYGEKRSIEPGKYGKLNSVQNGRDPPKNYISSDVASSRPFLKDNPTASVAGKSRREYLGSETEKLLSRKDKTLTENVVEKKSKSLDQIKRQIPPEKDKDKRNAASWKPMDAWKEKRNWEDILASPFRVSSRVSYSPGIGKKSAERLRSLHDKLMSPEKKKKTPVDLKKEAEEKHARAMRIRSELENERVQKLQRTSEKLIRVNEWQAVRTMKLREGMYSRQQRSESRHEAFLAEVVRRAGDESSKVNEVRFITSLNEENKKITLRQKLQDSELRRAEKLQVMKSKQKEDMAREEAVIERRKLIEAEKLQRLAEIQKKKEDAQLRREEERKASSAAREARAVEQLRRREERAKAQQEEAELLAQKLAEKLRESEQRRKFYLEQIRERASMDFRDQSSPLMRRSINKESQGRSTPTNGVEDCQANGSSILGNSALATGNSALQHSLKRRIKRIRQRLMALKFEIFEPPAAPENTGIGYRTAVGTARAKIGRWLQELQKLRQARKEGASSIGLITAEMIKFLEGKEPELHASRQAGLLDFIASALPASHSSKPEACQVTIHLLKLLRVVLSTPVNQSYFLAQNLLPPMIPMLSAALENYIKIAASLNLPGSSNSLSCKTSLENFESVSEVLDGFLWAVSSIIGHISSDERQLQMRDGLLELLVAYQVIHRFRDLFALYDRPQVEGFPFPSSILLSIHLLVVLTSSPGKSCINWESLHIEMELGTESQDTKITASADSRCSFGNINPGDNTPQLCAPSGSIMAPLSDVPEDRPLDEPRRIDNNDSSVELINLSISKVDVTDASQKILVEQKEEKAIITAREEKLNENISSVKQPVTFLLSAISETGLVTLPSLLTSVLLQANNKLPSEQASNALPSNFEDVATGVLKVLNNLALLDITYIQGMLARPDLKMEFFHLMSFLLSFCTSKWKAANDQIGLLLLESLLLLGYFALFHSGNQAVLRWGKSPTILHKVCDLPFVFFSDPELMPVLAGTLLAACYGCEQNKDVVQQELSMDMLLSLLRSCRNILPTVRSSNSNPEILLPDDPNECNHQGSDLRRSQGDVPLRSGRYNTRNTRISGGKGRSVGNGLKIGKMRNQRESRSTKICEETTIRHDNNLPVLGTSLMLYSRFSSSFINRAEQFFSAGISNEGTVS
ncbi:Detected protein of unknown function [Hibiscus syriacus]|uniref:S phase cyclin A-associated protein in the endoplasmic reticulum N-terminal domain-containing protein n=1 Tax=Hibiscus syriacus TaxID=106335 RepID=A0A6A2ZQT5_HIBSY|nr:uncharacterized protein LOC120141002 [Hibiscus syriacus]XP_039011895.1 uncharacterized protein LOC120141002 [Hibiscus syriacus]KAE8693946.1 Detected protein of unknown function [Hibiscus syriacus]